MNSNQLQLILNSINLASPKGVGIFALSKETAIDNQTLRNFLKNNPDYFVKLPKQSSYQLNRFGKFKGSVGLMLHDFNAKQQPQLLTNNWLLIIILTSTFISLGCAIFIAQAV
ncbi:MAG: hypothetical protein HRU22_18550 [Gammaproteobacteria bacterium]|nr:hypothetical protein [Gammaproteobacteria bacterium]